MFGYIQCMSQIQILTFKERLFLKKNYQLFSYLFGCTGSWVQHMGSCITACELPSCVWHEGLFALWLWDFGSLTRDQTYIPGIARWLLNHRTIRKVPKDFY